MSTETIAAKAQPEAMLVKLYQRNGYMRVPNNARRKKEPRKYKKGYEIRFVANAKREITTIRRLLRQSGLKGGRPFQKNNQWIQPVYGKQAMDRFKMWLEEFG